MNKTRLFNVDAIILRRRDFSEADRLLTVLTADHGKMRLLAKGVRKTKSRKAGHLELFMHTALQVAEGRNFGIVTQADTVQAYRALREDLDKISHAYYLSEMIDRFTEDNDPSFALFELMALTLARLSDGNPIEQFLSVRYFDLHLLRITGYQPQLHFCVSCNNRIEAEDNYFHGLDGGILCPTCGEKRPRARRLPLSALKVLRFLQTRPWEEAAKLKLTENTQRDVERVVLDYISVILERKLKSIDFLKRLRRQERVEG
ncbi:MAG: DNA repair protein RecO [Chloroflexota bacterium]